MKESKSLHSKPSTPASKNGSASNQTVSYDVEAQFERLSNLTDGWLDGEGAKPSEKLIDYIHRRLVVNKSRELPFPLVFPAEEGGLELEWRIRNRTGIITIYNDAETCEWFFKDFDSGEEAFEDLPFLENTDWRNLMTLAANKLI